MLVLVRGLPGSGKSTMARQLSPVVIEADDFFIGSDGVYRFDGARIGAAHADCLHRTERALRNNPIVCIANTFSQRWEMEPYLQLAKRTDMRLVVIEVQTALSDAALAARNVHNVPSHVIAAMRTRWETDWRNGNPLPPWQRH